MTVGTVHIAGPYADSGSDRLSLALGGPSLDARAVLPAVVAGERAELRVLGASHQVIAGPISETVACLPGSPGDLPEHVATEIEGWSYGFASEIAKYDADAFAEEVARLRHRLDGRDDAIVGVFPGLPDAVTALVPAPEGWRTWHTYPQTLEIVRTSTKVVNGGKRHQVRVDHRRADPPVDRSNAVRRGRGRR